MPLIRNLIQLYLLGLVAMLLYLTLGEDLSFEDALKPALLWPKTLWELIDRP